MGEYPENIYFSVGVCFKAIFFLLKGKHLPGLLLAEDVGDTMRNQYSSCLQNQHQMETVE